MAMLKKGLAGEPVRRLQAKLGVPTDGEFGPGTETALKEWQKKNGLAADGIAGPDTFIAMGLYELIQLKQGTKGSAVKALQEKLGVPADGDFGGGTAKAVRDYQAKKRACRGRHRRPGYPGADEAIQGSDAGNREDISGAGVGCIGGNRAGRCRGRYRNRTGIRRRRRPRQHLGHDQEHAQVAGVQGRRLSRPTYAMPGRRMSR